MVGTSFDEATRVTPLDSHTYEVNLQDDWAVGSVPHGGYVTAIFLRTTSTHFHLTHPYRNQPHCLTLHLSFLRRTSVGPARLTVSDMKIGGQTSTVHVALSQLNDKSNSNSAYRPCVAGYITHANLDRPFTGGLDLALSLPTNWSLDPPPRPVNLSKLASGDDANWARIPAWHAKFRRAYTRYEVYGPCAGMPDASIIDEWIRLEDSPNQKITQEALGSVVDLFPLMIENYREKLAVEGTEEQKTEVARWPPFWCPTVVLNLEVKKVLPKEGVDWLFVRVRTKEVRGGKMDYEVVVMDEGGELVALSHHVILVLGAGRNLAERGGGKDGSKM